MPTDPVGLQGMKDKTKSYLANIDLDDVSRKSHDRILYDLARLFRSTRSITHKKMLVK